MLAAASARARAAFAPTVVGSAASTTVYPSRRGHDRRFAGLAGGGATARSGVSATIVVAPASSAPAAIAPAAPPAATSAAAAAGPSQWSGRPGWLPRRV